jgi:energy-coupling factor transporter ATP-binding protein EcfA2
LIRETTQGKTLLIVEHDMEAVFALADRISVLVQGRIIATGTPADIAADPWFAQPISAKHHDDACLKSMTSTHGMARVMCCMA